MFKFISEGIKRIPNFQTFFVKTALRFPKELLLVTSGTGTNDTPMTLIRDI